MTAQAWVAAVVGIAAIADDLWKRRISNWIPCLAFGSGLILQSRTAGWRGAGAALLGTAAGAAVFLVFYVAGGMGGGDVKLMAGFGALLGTRQLLEAALWTAGCGGIMAMLAIAYSNSREFWRNRNLARTGQDSSAPESSPSRRLEAIPYAPAIAAGVWLSLVPKS
ncbi:MAG TPA: A24 family peptidase [Bryobacteraceae bacterium]|nr:A24 family peptidase [Bryobacteraceae bacterium]